MIDARDLSEKLPDLQGKLQRTLQHEGAVDGLIRLMPLFLGFLEHESQLREKTSPEAQEKLQAVQAAAVTLAERIKGADGEPIERIRGYLANALTPRTAPDSTFAGDVLVRTAVAIAVHLNVDEDTRRVTDGLPARELVDSVVQQTDALVGVIAEILEPTGRPDEHANKVIACGVAEILADNGIDVATTPNGEFDAALRDVLEVLGSYGSGDRSGLLELGHDHVTPKRDQEPA